MAAFIRVGCVLGLWALAALGVAAEAPDLIVADLNMPKLDGESLLKSLKEAPATRPIPVVIADSAIGPDCTILSAHVTGATIEGGTRVGPFAYLRDVLPKLHALGGRPTDEHLTPLLPDRWIAGRAASRP